VPGPAFIPLLIIERAHGERLVEINLEPFDRDDVGRLLALPDLRVDRGGRWRELRRRQTLSGGAPARGAETALEVPLPLVVDDARRATLAPQISLLDEHFPPPLVVLQVLLQRAHRLLL
jgi:hypothetical protein